MKQKEEVVLYPNKLKHLLMLAVSAGFTAIGFLMVKDGKWMGYLCGGFFGLGIPIFIIQMFPGASYLKLQKEGFEYSTMFRHHYVKWCDIAEFGIMTQRHSGMTTNKMVGWNYMESFESQSIGRSFSKSIGGIEAGLPDTYGLKAEKLLEIMFQCWDANNQNTTMRPTEPPTSVQLT
jgi:hypothetical protein